MCCGDRVAEGDSTDALKQEVISYYNTTASCYSDDALSFWKDNQSRFPILSQMAAGYLVTWLPVLRHLFSLNLFFQRRDLCLIAGVVL